MTARLTDDEIDRARGRWDIITADVPMRRKGRELAGLCPFHAEKSPSFYICSDKGFYKCFGCSAHGNVVDFIMRTRGLGFVDAVHEINGSTPQPPREHAPIAPRDDADARQDAAAEISDILSGCTPIGPRTAAEMYLRMRGISPRQPGLLAHPALPCWELGCDRDGTPATLPALVAPITNSAGQVTALQRIWVLPRVDHVNGSGPADNRALLKTRKKCIGALGDGAVRLRPIEAVGTTLGFAEGVETAASARDLFRFPVWAACGTARFGFPAHWLQRHTPKGERPTIWVPPDRPPRDADTVWIEERPPSIWVPDHVERVIMFGDAGSAGEIVARFAAEYWARDGRDTEARFPDGGADDFNSQLLGVTA